MYASLDQAEIQKITGEKRQIKTWLQKKLDKNRLRMFKDQDKPPKKKGPPILIQPKMRVKDSGKSKNGLRTV